MHLHLQAGLKAGDSIASLAFYMGWSVLGDLADVRLAIAWTVDTVPAQSFYTTTVVHNAETISQSRFDSQKSVFSVHEAQALF